MLFRFLLRRAFEVLAGTQIILAVIQQWMIPSVKNSLIPFSNMDYTVATERLLKLSVSEPQSLNNPLTFIINLKLTFFFIDS